MVGVGPIRAMSHQRNSSNSNSTRSSLARVSIIDYHGHILLDTFVIQRETVTDYRTAVSGVRPADVHGPNALPFEHVRAKVLEILHGRILVGHAVHHDLEVRTRLGVCA